MLIVHLPCLLDRQPSRPSSGLKTVPEQRVKTHWQAREGAQVAARAHFWALFCSILRSELSTEAAGPDLSPLVLCSQMY